MESYENVDDWTGGTLELPFFRSSNDTTQLLLVSVAIIVIVIFVWWMFFRQDVEKFIVQTASKAAMRAQSRELWEPMSSDGSVMYSIDPKTCKTTGRGMSLSDYMRSAARSAENMTDQQLLGIST